MMCNFLCAGEQGLGLDNLRIIALDPCFRKLEVEWLLPQYNKAKKKLILCDYDGTLVATDQVRFPIYFVPS
jgi:hypothetical protein